MTTLFFQSVVGVGTMASDPFQQDNDDPIDGVTTPSPVNPDTTTTPVSKSTKDKDKSTNKPRPTHKPRPPGKPGKPFHNRMPIPPSNSQSTKLRVKRETQRKAMGTVPSIGSLIPNVAGKAVTSMKKIMEAAGEASVLCYMSFSSNPLYEFLIFNTY